MNVVIDTNLLVRFLVADDSKQYALVLALFAKAQSITIPTMVLCETVWVLRGYKIDKNTIAEHIAAITQTDKIIVADDEVRAGLDVLESGGDFADGVAAYTGRRLAPGTTAVFVSFDQAAVRLLKRQGYAAFVPGQESAKGQ